MVEMVSKRLAVGALAALAAALVAAACGGDAGSGAGGAASGSGDCKTCADAVSQGRHVADASKFCTHDHEVSLNKVTNCACTKCQMECPACNDAAFSGACSDCVSLNCFNELGACNATPR